MISGNPALQEARDHIGRAQQRVAGLRTSLKQASANVSVRGDGLIVTPALLDTLSRTHKVRACMFSQNVQPPCSMELLWLVRFQNTGLPLPGVMD